VRQHSRQLVPSEIRRDCLEPLNELFNGGHSILV
jgi:hypothetical protein